MNDVGRRGFVPEAQLQLVKMLPYQAVEAVSVKVDQFVVWPRADEPAGHRAAPLIEGLLPSLLRRFSRTAFSRRLSSVAIRVFSYQRRRAAPTESRVPGSRIPSSSASMRWFRCCSSLSMLTPHSCQKRSVRMICRGIQYCSIGSHSRSGISIKPNWTSSGNKLRRIRGFLHSEPGENEALHPGRFYGYVPSGLFFPEPRMSGHRFSATPPLNLHNSQSRI